MTPSAAPTDTAPIATPAKTAASFRWWQSSRDVSALITVERDKESGECRDPWRFISLDFDLFTNMTPLELRQLGRWLVKEGSRIGKEYKSNGAMKTPSNAELCGGPSGPSERAPGYASGGNAK